LNKVGVNGCQIIIGFSGILRKWHGVDLLISAFLYLIEKNMNLYLLIVGDGPERCNIEKQLAQVISTNKYHITGRIPHSQVVDYINLFDIAVSPKSTFYASPMKVLEYMAMGKAVLVPDRPNFRDLITPGKTGLTFMDGSPEDLARNIKALCENREQMRTIGENARQRILNRYNWQWNANYVCSLI
jgi:glycosyltransferase involved in cell wall biosynthesis